MKHHAFWCSDVAAAASVCQSSYPDAVTHAIRTADEVCDNVFTFTRHWDMERCVTPVHFAGEIDWCYCLNGDNEWLYQLNRHGFLVDLAKAYHYTGAQRYVDCFVRLVEDWIKRVPCDAGGDGTPWRSLEVGLRCANWLRSLELLRDVLPASTQTAMYDCLIKHGAYLESHTGEFQILSNWGVLQDEGLFLLSLAFDRADWQQHALERLAVNLHCQVFDDGSHWEQSPMYHGEVLHCFLQVAAVAHRCGVTLPDGFDEGVRRLCSALGQWTMPGGVLPWQSDTDDIDARDLVAKGGVLYADGLLKALADGRLFEENIWDFDASALEAYRALLMEPRPVSTALPDSGNYILRSGTDAQANAVHFHSGCIGSGHGHADLLHIDVAAYGENILVDSGRFTYLNTPQRLALKSVFAHNTTIVDGVPFTKPQDTWGYETLAQPLPCAHKFTPVADYVCGAHVGYLEQGLGVLAQRKVVFLKPDIIVLFDVFYTAPDAAHTYEQRFHFAPGGAVTQTEHGVHFMGKAAQAQLISLAGGQCRTEACEVSPRYNEMEPSTRFVVQTQRTGFASLVTVLALGKADAPQTVQARLEPVRMQRTQCVLPQEKAQGVVITHAGQTHTVIASHGECVSGVDLLSCNGHSGYGKLLVFENQTPQGTCLAW